MQTADNTQTPPSSRDPLAAVPVATDGISVSETGQGRVLLSWQAPARTTLGRWFARRCGWARVARIELDERGSAFWRAIDGRRSLHEIDAGLHYTPPLDQDARSALLIEFTKALMLRGVICLRLPDRPEA